MNRRGFLSGLGALVGGVLLDKAVPLGRVWSFPKEVKCVNVAPVAIGATIEQYADFVTSADLLSIAEAYYDKALPLFGKNFNFLGRISIS